MVKRAFDLLIAVVVSLMFAPLILVIALLIRLKIGSPVIFKQLRPGLHTKPFYIYKFRTMSDKKDMQGALLSDAKRLSNFGRIIRSTSLDELPSLWNLLKGDRAGLIFCTKLHACLFL